DLLLCPLLGLLLIRRRTRASPGIVFFLRVRNALECFVVGLLVYLRLLLIGLVAAGMPLAASHLRFHRQHQQREERNRDRQRLHQSFSPRRRPGETYRVATPPAKPSLH